MSTGYFARITVWSVILLFIHFADSCAQSLIPLPALMEKDPKERTLVFPKKGGVDINFIGSGIVRTRAERFRDQLTKYPAGHTNTLRLHFTTELPSESYTLNIDRTGIDIWSGSDAGFLYSLQTLQQLKTITKRGRAVFPYIHIDDRPNFKWRGMHLDVSRHFFNSQEVKQYLQLMAQFKMNVFHWHLVDDQGWRIEIKKYPLLTSVGAWRVDHNNILWGERPQALPGEEPTYGGFYTQEEIKNIVAFADSLGITIVPEIEMPGHAAAAIASYPNLSCNKIPQLPLTGGNYNNTTSNYCAGNDSVKAFLTDVLTEVLELFPSKYIHLGGDEVDKSNWKTCKVCTEYCQRNQIASMDSLQSDFMHYFDSWLSAKGRIMIGWDEILEGGLAPQAAVMSWRGMQGGIDAVKLGHDVVMTPGRPCYFDHYQAEPAYEPKAIGGLNTVADVYAFDPVPDAFTDADKKHILGGQANLWCEYITTFDHALYMLLPRMPALAEALWTPKEKRNRKDFLTRLEPFKACWLRDSIPFGPEHRGIKFAMEQHNDSSFITMKGEITNAEIVYTTNGTDPMATSAKYQSGILFNGNMEVRANWLRDGKILFPEPSKEKLTWHTGVKAKVIWNEGPAPKYPAEGLNSIINGMKGDMTVSKKWQGFNGTDADFHLEWNEPQWISTVDIRFLHAPKSWIFLPDSMEVYGSQDGENYRLLTSTPLNNGELMDETKLIRDGVAAFLPQYYKKLRIHVYNRRTCPPGHPGEGQPAWIFMDECSVR